MLSISSASQEHSSIVSQRVPQENRALCPGESRTKSARHTYIIIPASPASPKAKGMQDTEQSVPQIKQGVNLNIIKATGEAFLHKKGVHWGSNSQPPDKNENGGSKAFPSGLNSYGGRSPGGTRLDTQYWQSNSRQLGLGENFPGTCTSIKPWLNIEWSPIKSEWW
jgi:hypothetical protein